MREIVINLPAFRLYLYEDRRPVRAYPIAIGQIVQPSVLGSTMVVNRVVDPIYYPPEGWGEDRAPIPPGPDNPVGTRWIGLAIPGYGIHGTNNPASIGTAASAGCIRMYNEDVEELHALVRIGTPVHFLYETLLAWRDGTGVPFIQVHPDLYRLGSNRLDAALAKLARIGVNPEEVSRPGLRGLLHEASGRPHPVPYPLPVHWEGQRLPPGFRAGDELYLPADKLARAAGAGLSWRGGRLVLAGTEIGGARRDPDGIFAPARAVVKALGLGGRVSPQQADLHGVWLYEGERPLQVRGWLDEGRLLLPLEEVARLLGFWPRWDARRQAPILDGRPVAGGRRAGARTLLPYERVAALLGVEIRWEPGARQARLRVAQVRLDDERLADPAFLPLDGEASGQGGEGVLIPLRPVAERLGMRVEWDPSREEAILDRRSRIGGLLRGDRLYTTLAEARRALPEATFGWDGSALAVEIRRVARPS